MNRLNPIERNFLIAVKPHLKDGVPEQTILNLLRVVEQAAEQKGRSGYMGDTTWTDEQLM